MVKDRVASAPGQEGPEATRLIERCLDAAGARLTDAQRLLVPKVVTALQAGRFDPPWVRELSTLLRVPEHAMRSLLRVLAESGQLHEVVHDLFYTPDNLHVLARLFAGIALRDGTVRVGDFRDASGLGRKRAVQILEYLDQIGFCAREDEARRILDAGVLLEPDEAGKTSAG